MLDRRFNEAELRLMLEDASGYHEGNEQGRWVVETKHGGRVWEIIVEPVFEGMIVVIVTAYPVDPTAQS